MAAQTSEGISVSEAFRSSQNDVPRLTTKVAVIGCAHPESSLIKKSKSRKPARSHTGVVHQQR